MTGCKTDSTASAKSNKLFQHYCEPKDCKAWGSISYKTATVQLWFYREHNQEGEDALVGRRK